MEVSNKTGLPGREQAMHSLFYPLLLNSFVVSQKH